MKIKFFSRLSNAYRSQFRAYYIGQNLDAVRAIGIIYFVMDIALKICPYVLNLHPDQVKHLEEYDVSITAHLIATPFFIVLSSVLRRRFKKSTKYLLAGQVLTILFALYLISAGMIASFLGMHNPRNTITFYMTMLMLTGIFYVFEYYETLLIAVITTVIFTAMLPNYLQEPRELLLNQFASGVLMLAFFSLSRYVFSYRANHFIQLKTINEKSAEIEVANHVKDEILGIVAHDLRNPLAAIESITSLMQLDEHLDEEGMDNVLMIKASCERAKLIINDLLEVARNDMDSEFEVSKTDLNRFLFHITEEWLNNKTTPAKIVYHGTKQPVYVWINKEKIRRVMDNLISNAVKFSGHDNHIEISLRHANGFAFIDVKDFGVGIPNDLLPNVFDRFSKASRKGLHGEESIGLGLSIVKQIVTKHGGEVKVKSVEKKGTTFTISLHQSLAS